MKFVKYTFSLMIILLLFVLSYVNVFATETGFSTKELSNEDFDTFIDNVTIELITEEPSNKFISCFDVNEQGWLAIGCESGGNKTVSVYSNGEFMYGYEFYTNGSFGLEWDDDNLNIYFVRSDVLACVNEYGEINELCMVENTQENNSYYINYFLSTKKTINSIEYELKKDLGMIGMIIPRYTKVISRSDDGIETIIYSSDSSYVSNSIVLLVFIVVFVIGVLFVSIKNYRKFT